MSVPTSEMQNILTMDPNDLSQLLNGRGAGQFTTPLAASLASAPIPSQTGGGFAGKVSSLLNNPLTSLGVGLLAGSGPFTTPKSFGQILGQGMGMAQQSQQNALQNQLLRMRFALSLARLQAMQGAAGTNPQNTTTGQ